MKDVSKVFSGASGILVNGTLISRCGTGIIGLLAHNFRVPFIVFCESYKFSERS
jgi:translation initiation factor eIF-2B subunit delta